MIEGERNNNVHFDNDEYSVCFVSLEIILRAILNIFNQ